LSLKKKPVIRYENVSAMGKRLAQEIQVRWNYYPAIELLIVSHYELARSIKYNKKVNCLTFAKPTLLQYCLFWIDEMTLSLRFCRSGRTKLWCMAWLEFIMAELIFPMYLISKRNWRWMIDPKTVIQCNYNANLI
jgi:hypothetical protein